MKSGVIATAILATFSLGAASASTASQREYRRGFADCSTGKYDRERHGASYKRGCRAAENARADAPEAVKGDAKVPGTKYHATGDIPCATAEGQPMAQCPFGVVRRGGGSATVTVSLPGWERNIVFKQGKAASSDSRAGITSEKAQDLSKVFIGTTERYEIPDIVLFGD